MNPRVEVSSRWGPVEVDKEMVDTCTMICKEGYCITDGRIHDKVCIQFESDDFQKLVKHAYRTRNKDHDTAQALGEDTDGLWHFLIRCQTAVSWHDDGLPDDDRWIHGNKIYFEIYLSFDAKLHSEFKKLFKRSHSKMR